jgi:hypothetical protein
MKFKICNGGKRFWRTFFLSVLVFIVLGTLGAGGMRMAEDEIRVTGRIYLMGNEPFTQVGIESENGKVFAVIGEQEKELRGLQGKRLTVKGNLGGKTTRGVESIKVKSFKVMEPK